MQYDYDIVACRLRYRSYKLRYRTSELTYDIGYDIEVNNCRIDADIEVHVLRYRKPTISYTRYRSSVPTIS